MTYLSTSRSKSLKTIGGTLRPQPELEAGGESQDPGAILQAQTFEGKQRDFDATQQA